MTMKNTIKKLIFTFLLTVIFCPKVMAFEDSCKTLKDGNLTTCLSVCGYDFDTDGYSGSITVDFKSEKVAVGALYLYGLGTPSALTFTNLNHENLFFQGNVKEALLNNGTCPQNMYIDNDFNVEVCFDNDGKWCNSQETFGTNFDKKGSLTYNISDTIKNFFDNYELDEDKLLDIENYNLQDIVSKDFSEDILYSYPIPSIIKNMPEYNAGFNTLEQRVREYGKKLKEEKEEEYKNGNITQEEYQEYAGKVDSTIATQAEGVKNAMANINMNFKSELDFSVEEGSCTAFLGDGSKGTPLYYLKFAFTLIKYASIVLLLVLTIVEFAKALASSNDDALKKAGQVTLKRVIIVVIIFFLPNLINFLLKMFFGSVTNPTCGIK